VQSLLTELRRRSVIRAAGTYLIVAWIAMQVVEVMAPALILPEWVDGLVALLLIVAFPIVVVLAWIFEVSPEGIVRTGPGDKLKPPPFGMLDTFLLIALVVVIGLWSYKLIGSGSSELHVDDQSDQRRGKPAIVAVLPFSNVSSDPEQDHLADGLAIDIVSRLESLRLFPIISPNSSFIYRNRSVTITQVGNELGADYVVVGTLQRSGEQLRITAQLADTKSGLTIWSNTYERQIADLFELQDDIARTVAASVAPELRRSEIGKTRSVKTKDMAAYELYLKGIRLARTEDYDQLLAARSFLLAAIERAPDFASAYVELAWLEHDRITYYNEYTTLEEATEARDLALEYARRAVSSDPQLGEARSIFGHMLLHYQRIDEGVKEMELSVKLNPSSARIHSQASWGQIVSGNYEAGLSSIETATTLNPLDPQLWEYISNEAYAYWLMGDYEKTREKAEESISLNPDNEYMYAVVISTFWQMGDPAAAREVALALTDKFPQFTLTTLEVTSFPPRAVSMFQTHLKAAGWREPRDQNLELD
jgi:adenylate cyclase